MTARSGPTAAVLLALLSAFLLAQAGLSAAAHRADLRLGPADQHRLPVMRRMLLEERAASRVFWMRHAAQGCLAIALAVCAVGLARRHPRAARWTRIACWVAVAIGVTSATMFLLVELPELERLAASDPAAQLRTVAMTRFAVHTLSLLVPLLVMFGLLDPTDA